MEQLPAMATECLEIKLHSPIHPPSINTILYYNGYNCHDKWQNSPELLFPARIFTRLRQNIQVRLSNVESVQDENVLIVLRKRHDVSLRRYLQATTATHFHVWTLKLANECRVTLEHRNMEPIAVAVTNEYVAGITDVNAIRIVGQVLTTNAAKKLSLLAEYDDTVTLQNQW